MSYPLFLREEFKQWLIDSNIVSAESGSAGSYASYVAGVNHQFIIEGFSMCDLIEKHFKAGMPQLINEVISDIHAKLYLSDICQITGKAKKTIDNWRCGLLTYKEFFYITTDEVEPDETITNLQEELPNIEIVISKGQTSPLEVIKATKKDRTETYVYSTKELMANFKFRMITQDRFYGDIFFPISYIKSLLYRKGQQKYFDSWVDDQLSIIDILCETETHKLKDISELKLIVSKEHSEATITVNKQIKTVYTSNALGTRQFPLSSISLKRISIDHINPMKKILMDNMKSLPQLGIITGQLKMIANHHATSKVYKAAGKILLNQPPSNQFDINLLKAELDFIKACTKLQLMDKTENLKKSAN